jgi:hypothetical protein
MKKNEKKCSLQFEKTYVLYYSFLAGPLALHFQDALWSLRRRSYVILNYWKWRRVEKDLPKCLVIGRRSVMGQSTLPFSQIVLMLNQFFNTGAHSPDLTAINTYHQGVGKVRFWLIAHPGLHCSTTGFLCQNQSNLASPLVHIMFYNFHVCKKDS